MRELEGKIDEIHRSLNLESITRAFQAVLQDQLSQQQTQNAIMQSQQSQQDQRMLSQSVVILEEKTAEFNNAMESLNGMVEKFNAMMKTQASKPPEVMGKPPEPAMKEVPFKIPSLKSEAAPFEEKKKNMDFKPLTMNIKFAPAM